MKRFLDDLRETIEANGFLGFIFWIIVVALLFAAAAKGWAAPVKGTQYQRLYTRIATQSWGGLDAPVASLAAQIHQESGWDCMAVSRVGARGCAQFMPSTAKWIAGFSPTLASGLVNDPAWAFEAQVRYMRWLYDRVQGTPPCERMAFAAAGYNGGLAYVYKRQKASRAPLRCFDATCDINPGITEANQRENAAYPRRILRVLEPQYRSWGRGICA